MAATYIKCFLVLLHMAICMAGMLPSNDPCSATCVTNLQSLTEQHSSAIGELQSNVSSLASSQTAADLDSTGGSQKDHLCEMMTLFRTMNAALGEMAARLEYLEKKDWYGQQCGCNADCPAEFNAECCAIGQCVCSPDYPFYIPRIHTCVDMWLGAQCVDDEDCPGDIGACCNEGLCTCAPGLSYSNNMQTCLDEYYSDCDPMHGDCGEDNSDDLSLETLPEEE